MAPAPTLGSLILLSLSVINAQAQGESSRARVKIVSINIQMLEIKSRKLTFKIDISYFFINIVSRFPFKILYPTKSKLKIFLLHI